MRMRLLFTLGLLALSCGGGAAKEIPQADACPEASMAICGKVFSCPAGDIVLTLVQSSLGGSDAACQSTIAQMYCGALTCTNGQKYHGDKAYQCKEQFKGATCSGISAALITSSGSVPMVIGALAPACNEVCSN